MSLPPQHSSSSWLQSAALYKEPRIIGILFLGFSSGLPFLLTLATLHVWLTEVGVTKSTIGLFAAVTLPYSLKFIWAPVLDHVRIPVLSDVFGHRKSWMLLSQIMLVMTLVGLGKSNPGHDIQYTAVLAFLVSFFSASQDICIEAYRVQKLGVNEIGIGAGASHLGYRLGMWVAGAGALYLAASFSWSVVYSVMAGCMAVGIVTVLLSQEPTETLTDQLGLSHTLEQRPSGRSFHWWLWSILTKGVRDTLSHLKTRGDMIYVILFILVFKLIDTFLNAMTVPFLLESGFDKVDIANVGKSFGIGAMIIGGLCAGVLLAQQPLRKMLLLCGVLQCGAAIAFYAQSQIGYNLYALFVSVGLDNFANGMSFAAFIAYLSYVSKGGNAGTHFAFLTSMASLARVFFSYLAGVCAEHMTWGSFYLLTAVLSIPLLVMVARTSYFSQRFST